MKQLPKYFFRGLLILIPVVVTAYVFYAVFVTLDEMVFQHIGEWIETAAPGQQPTAGPVRSILGIAGAILLITAVGLFASNFIGRRLVAAMEKLLDRVPLIKLLHGSVRDVLGAFVGDKKSFDHPVLVSLTEGGPKVLGFVTRDSLDFLGVEDHAAVYLPQSYNFAGNVLVVPRSRVQPLPVASSDVMTFLVSGGVSGRQAG